MQWAEVMMRCRRGVDLVTAGGYLSLFNVYYTRSKLKTKLCQTLCSFQFHR